MPVENPFLTQDQQLVGDIYTATHTMDNLITLCDDYGARFSGSAQEHEAAQFMANLLRSYGLHNVHLQEVEFVGWTRGTVNLSITSPVEKVLDCITLPHSPPCDLRAPVIDLGDGHPDDFAARADDIAGKIVMVTSEVKPKGIDRWVHRSEKYNRSAMAGALGFIFINHYPGFGPATGGIGEGGEAPIPGISVSYEDGQYLRRLIERKGEISLHLQSTDRCSPMVSYNVIADLPGHKDPNQVVMLGCHYDGHDIAQGAGDPASGAVALLEAARVLARYASNLPYTIRFALWGIEEIGLLGSTAYVEKNVDKLDQIRFYLNMDAAGMVLSKDIQLNEWPELQTLLEGWQKEMALDFAVGQSVSAFSDHYPFFRQGVPTGGIGSVRQVRGGRGFGHTRYDTVDKLNLQTLREAAALAARLALRLASVDAWPVSRRSVEDVEALLASKPNYKAEQELEAQVKEYYARLGR